MILFPMKILANNVPTKAFAENKIIQTSFQLCRITSTTNDNNKKKNTKHGTQNEENFFNSSVLFCHLRVEV